MDWSVWAPPLVVLAISLVVGGLLAFRARAGRVGTLRLEDRVALRDASIERLRQHEADRGKLAPDVWEQRRLALLDAAALAWKDEDEAVVLGQGAPGAVPTHAQVGLPRRLAWVLGSLAFVGLLAWGLKEASAPRAQGGMGAMDGGAAEWAAAGAAAKAALEADPRDLAALNLLTWHAIAEQDLQTAMGLLDRAREISPDDPEVITHMAIMQAAVGFPDRAEAGLDRALLARPDFARALIWKALIRKARGDTDAARSLATRAAAAAVSADEKGAARALLQELDAPPAVVHVQGTVRLADGAVAPPGAVLFVYARASDQAQGPPTAVQRQAGASLPAAFALSDREILMGAPWPAQVWVQARLDADGNAMTRGEQDLASALIGPLEAGVAPIELVLAPLP
jgi:tetratricopeptide (TPR) repeat protein